MIDEQHFTLFDEDEEEVDSGESLTLRDELRDTYVYNLDWTVATLVSQLEANVIDLQPMYQRRDAWTVQRKSKLIESLILGLPIPHLVLAEHRDAKGTFLILDGKQRLTTLAQFVGALPDSPHNNFTLKDLPLLPALNGFNYSQLVEAESLREFKNAFLNQPLRTAILRGWKSAGLLHVIFHRLNSQVVPLSPQELRQALIPGPFMKFLNDFSAESVTMQTLLNLKGPDFRMRDSELLLRLLALTKYGDTYRGDLRLHLDRTAELLSDKWGEMEHKTLEDLRLVERAIEVWFTCLGPELVGRKFIDGVYERRLNRAVLDSQVFAALDEKVSAKISERPNEVKAAFEKLMSEDESYRRAIEATTKSMPAVRYRMDKLHAILTAI